MVDNDCIVETVERIVREFAPQRVILFGSYAYGTPTDGSDVDLLVIMPFAGSHIDKAVEILERVDPRFSIDLLVRTPEQVRQRLEWNDFFLRDVMERGQVLYAAPDRGVDKQSGGRLGIGAARAARKPGSTLTGKRRVGT